MTRERKIRMAMILCAMVLVIAVGLALSGILKGGIGYAYANAEKYTAGETELDDSIRNLDLNWIDGTVQIAYHDQKTVTLRETSEKTISEDMRMRWWLDGDTLRVQYAKPGIHLGTNLNKQLTLTLPASLVLSRVSISTTSGDVFIPELKADSLEMNSTSGDLQATAEAGTLRTDTTSGDQRLTLTGKTDSVKMGATSGNILLRAENAGKCDASSTSGNLEIRVLTAGEIQVGCTSGTVYVGAGQLDRLKASTTSGNITAGLPAEPGFTASVTTTSGKINSDIPVTRNGNTYVCGDGSDRVELSATSGNVHLTAWDETWR